MGCTKAGTISISGSVSLVVPTGDYDKEAYKNSDGVRVAIQKGKSELWNKTITKGDEDFLHGRRFFVIRKEMVIAFISASNLGQRK